MTEARLSESDVTVLRRLARAAAERRGEALGTVHLLEAVLDLGGPAARMLAERNLGRAAVAAIEHDADEPAEAVERVLGDARDIARRAAVPSREAFPSTHGDCRPAAAEQPSGIHVLLALLGQRRYGAYRALAKLTDAARLRTAIMRIAIGVVKPPRVQNQRLATPEARSTEARSTGEAEVVEAAPAAPRQDTPPLQRGSRAAKQAPSRGAKGRIAKGRAVEVPLVPPLRKAFLSEPRPAFDTKPPESKPPDPKPPESKPPDPKLAEAKLPDPKLAEAQTSDKELPEVDVWTLDADAYPMLASIGRNLTEAALAGRLEPVFGRDVEVEQALDILAKRHANNPVLTGPAGVGKTSVARAIAHKLADEGQVLVELPVAELLAGTGARGSLAERLADIRAEVKAADRRVVLFVDELHELLDGGDEVVAELKSALAHGELPLVGATSSSAFRRMLETDPALARRFSEIPIEEPSEADAFLLLRRVADGLSRHHGVRYADEAIAVAVSWSIRYLPGRALPDKAVALLDLAGARRRRRAEPNSPGPGKRRPKVDMEHVAELVAETADVPVERLMQTDHERMLVLEKLLSERVIGHDEACGRIAAVLRRNAAGLRGKRPIGTLLLLGPTGVGKTETAKAVAEVLFGSGEAMTRLDMSEYSEAHAVARLIGAPPGYVGHDAGGLLTEAVRRRPYQVVLLDEIEKAHRDVLQAFLQVFDEGRLTDGRGRTVDFTNTVITLTSNLGADELRGALNERRVGFGRSDPNQQGPEARTTQEADRLRELALGAARAALPPELYNRIDEVLFFRHLARADVRSIAQRLLSTLAAALEARGVQLEVDPSAIEALLDGGGYDPELGARPMRRAISRLIEAPLADMILRGAFTEGSVAAVSAEQGKISIVSRRGSSRRSPPGTSLKQGIGSRSTTP